MGRPRLPEADARSERVVTFLTPPELRRLHDLALQSGSSLSATAHALLLEAMNTAMNTRRNPNDD